MLRQPATGVKPAPLRPAPRWAPRPRPRRTLDRAESRARIVGQYQASHHRMSSSTPAVFSPGYARYALAVLFLVNLFNYVDRQIMSGVLSLVQDDLVLSDAALGALASAFTILYLLGSVPLGMLGDRVSRNRLIAVGVAVWGAATFLSGVARSY